MLSEAAQAAAINNLVMWFSLIRHREADGQGSGAIAGDWP
jgi:hypothetical protein